MVKDKAVYTCTYKSKLGDILLAADAIGLTGLWFEGQKYAGMKQKSSPAFLHSAVAARKK